jgi:hypothetical protein
VNRQRHLVNPGWHGVRKVDVVLVALGVVAAVATSVAFAKSDGWTDERTYTFSEGFVPFAAQGPTPAASAPARFEVPAAANATGATVDVLVAYSGQAIQGGTAVIRVSGVAPDGTNLPPLTKTLAIGQGNTAGEFGFTFNATWAEAPGTVRDTQEPAGYSWGMPLVLTVTVERPSDLPAATYAFTASVSGTFDAFVAA